MRAKPLFWQLFPWHLLAIVLALYAVTWYFGKSLDAFQSRRCESELDAIARLARDRLAVGTGLDDAGAVDVFCKRTREYTQTRLTVILPNGTVIGDSVEEPAHMENHADRPEIQEAMRSGRGTSTRYSRTLDARLLYVAVSVLREGTVVAVVRASRPLTQLHGAVAPLHNRVLLAAVLVGVLTVVVSGGVSLHLTRPLAAMRDGAERFAAGDLSFRMQEPPSAELGELAHAMNQMAGQLSSRIEAITHQRNEASAILGSMSEGVLAVDADQQVLTANQAAVALFRLDPDRATGRPMQEVVRNTDMQRLVTDVLLKRRSGHTETIVHLDNGDRVLSMRASPLGNPQSRDMGAVVVFSDITEVRRLERIRREFVANVSHELRTPITSLKGFVETLLDGAVDEPDTARRFLSIISRHTDRLEAIIEDLLLLSRIESGSGIEAGSFAETAIQAVAISARDLCKSMAEERSIDVQLDVGQELRARVNGRLIEHALVNLIDNAINYSEPGGCVRVSAAESDGGTLTVSVKDEGCGIARHHLAHVFERFYRVDKARSREAGGTGLGLAIVKHIVQAHGGSVAVESDVNVGSTFTIRLPIS